MISCVNEDSLTKVTHFLRNGNYISILSSNQWNFVSLGSIFFLSFKSPNWVLGNHDAWRIGSRLGEEFIDVMVGDFALIFDTFFKKFLQNTITLTLPGVAVTYQVSQQ